MQIPSMAFNSLWIEPTNYRRQATASPKRPRIRVENLMDSGHWFKLSKTGGSKSRPTSSDTIGSSSWIFHLCSFFFWQEFPCLIEGQKSLGPYLWRLCKLHRRNRSGSPVRQVGKVPVPIGAAWLLGTKTPDAHAESFWERDKTWSHKLGTREQHLNISSVSSHSLRPSLFEVIQT